MLAQLKINDTYVDPLVQREAKWVEGVLSRASVLSVCPDRAARRSLVRSAKLTKCVNYVNFDVALGAV